MKLFLILPNFVDSLLVFIILLIKALFYKLNLRRIKLSNLIKIIQI